MKFSVMIDISVIKKKIQKTMMSSISKTVEVTMKKAMSILLCVGMFFFSFGSTLASESSDPKMKFLLTCKTYSSWTNIFSLDEYKALIQTAEDETNAFIQGKTIIEIVSAYDKDPGSRMNANCVRTVIMYKVP